MGRETKKALAVAARAFVLIGWPSYGNVDLDRPSHRVVIVVVVVITIERIARYAAMPGPYHA